VINGSATPASTDQAPDAAELAAQLRLSATRLARRLRQETSSGLTPSQLSALATVGSCGTVTLGFLAERERISPPSVTKIVAKLEAEGLLERRVDGRDRRITRVTLTAAGDELLAESRRLKEAWLAARIRELDDDERARLAAALDVLDHLTAKERS
jgi:DNA-binding MarR family transcriptional regulator